MSSFFISCWHVITAAVTMKITVNSFVVKVWDGLVQKTNKQDTKELALTLCVKPECQCRQMKTILTVTTLSPVMVISTATEVSAATGSAAGHRFRRNSQDAEARCHAMTITMDLAIYEKYWLDCCSVESLTVARPHTWPTWHNQHVLLQVYVLTVLGTQSQCLILTSSLQYSFTGYGTQVNKLTDPLKCSAIRRWHLEKWPMSSRSNLHF